MHSAARRYGLLIVMLLGFCSLASPAAADEGAAGVQVDLDGGSEVRLAAPGTAKVVLRDTSGSPQDVEVAVSGAPEAGLSVDVPTPISLTPGKPVELNVLSATAVPEDTTAWLVVTAEGRGSIWTKIVAGPTAAAAPQVTAWPVTMTIGPRAHQGQAPALPLKASLQCPGSQKDKPVELATALLTRGNETAELKASCPAGEPADKLDLTLDGMSSWAAGDYTGKLTIGASTIDVTVKRQAPLELFIALLLLGCLLALVVRAVVGWRPLRAFDNEVEALEAPTGPTDEWSKVASDATAHTVTAIRNMLKEPNANKRTAIARWLCTPAPRRLELLETAKKALADAERIVAEWNAQAATIIAGLEGRDNLMPALRTRAEAIVNAPEEAMTEPAAPGTKGAPREGLSGLEEVLLEARRLAAVIAQIAQTPDLGGIEPQNFGGEQANLVGAAQSAVMAAGRWVSTGVGLVRKAGVRHAVTVGDYVTFGVAVLVVMFTVVASLYVGKGWGTAWDLAGVVVAAVGGSLVLTPLFQAVDRLGAGSGREGI